MPIAPDVFARFYAAINTEWPQFGLSAADAEVQEKRWRRAFGDFEAESLVYALDEWLAKSKKRPHVSDLMELAVAHARHRFKGGTTKLEVHWTRCPCGCGGQRWLRILRDANGKMRLYPASVGQLTEALPTVLAKIPEVVDALEPLASSPMMRVVQECKRIGSNPLPAQQYRVGVDDGDVPVYDPPAYGLRSS